MHRTTWKSAYRTKGKVITKICRHCGIEYIKPTKYGLMQWNRSKYCSMKCSSDNKKIKDGISKGERWRRRNGMTKQGTPEWIEKIKATTKEGMMKPEVKDKMAQPRSAMTLDNRIIRSDALAGMMPKNLTYSNRNFPNVQRGDYECSKGTVYFRSKWEANYALFLDFLIKNGDIIDWEYESETFFFEKIKLGTRSYRPDFKVFNPDETVEYHEVKGYMDARSKTKLKRMAKYFPETKLVLIERKFYSDMMKKLKGVIKFY